MYNTEAIRKAVIEHIETEMVLLPLAGKDLYKAEHGSLSELLALAKECGISTDKYLSEDE